MVSCTAKEKRFGILDTALGRQRESDLAGETAMPVLIVENDPEQRCLQARMLRNAGFAVVEADSGREALEQLGLQSFDLVLLNKQLPDMDGNLVVQAIRHTLDIHLLPVIMLTSCSEPGVLESSLRAGANDFVRKPFEPTELVAKVFTSIRLKQLVGQLDTAETVLYALARMVEAKDSNTLEHCARLVRTCQIFGETLGLSLDEVEALGKGAVLHDVGKIGVPDEVLRKPGRLNNHERDIMRRHPVIGAQLCEGLNSVRDALPVILHHHERWDGSGYPYGLAGEQIPRLARIFQLADIYDALSYRRPYSPPLSNERVIAMLKIECRKGWRDPELTEVFVEMIGSRAVELRTEPRDIQGPGALLFRQILCPADSADMREG